MKNASGYGVALVEVTEYLGRQRLLIRVCLMYIMTAPTMLAWYL